MQEFKDRVAVITGAAGNLGSTLAHRLDERGAALVLLDLHDSRLQQVCGDLAASDRHLLLGGVDATDDASVKDASGVVLKRFPRIDFLLNIAGGYRAGDPLHETSTATWELMFDLNAKSAFLMSRAFLPAMIKQKSGRIVNIGARPGLQGVRNAAAYSGAKSAVLRLTESMSAELKAYGINVNAIMPGTMDTPENRTAMPDLDPSRWVSLEAVSEVVLFLLSDAARAVHGAAVPVFGPESKAHV